jgi:SAM-dependent methyltransferase
VNRRVLEYLVCPRCEHDLVADDPDSSELDSGELRCTACDACFLISNGIAQLLPEPAADPNPTSELYSDIWHSYDQGRRKTQRKSRSRGGYRAPARSHVELLRLASGWSITESGIGIDAGSGDGSSMLSLAPDRPGVHIVGVDLSQAPESTALRVRGTPNVDLVRGDLLSPPLARDRFDFVYSFGVLHHTPDPRAAFSRLIERLRPGGKITIFVYKDFSDIPTKRFLLHQVNRLRRLTTRLSPATLRVLSRLAAPLVLVLLTWPARLLRALGFGRMAQHVPYGSFPDLSGIASSLEDRFGAPYEFRFSLAELQRWAAEEGLEEARAVDCLPWGFSGLVLAGRRPRTVESSASGRANPG